MTEVLVPEHSYWLELKVFAKGVDLIKEGKTPESELKNFVAGFIETYSECVDVCNQQIEYKQNYIMADVDLFYDMSLANGLVLLNVGVLRDMFEVCPSLEIMERMQRNMMVAADQLAIINTCLEKLEYLENDVQYLIGYKQNQFFIDQIKTSIEAIKNLEFFNTNTHPVLQ